MAVVVGEDGPLNDADDLFGLPFPVPGFRGEFSLRGVNDLLKGFGAKSRLFAFPELLLNSTFL